PAIPLALTNSSTGRQRSTSTVLRGCAPPGFSTTARGEPRPAWVKSLRWSDLSGERPEPCEGPERACHKHRRFLRRGTARSLQWSDRRFERPTSLPDASDEPSNSVGSNRTVLPSRQQQQFILHFTFPADSSGAPRRAHMTGRPPQSSGGP